MSAWSDSRKYSLPLITRVHGVFPNGQHPKFRTHHLIRAIHLPSIPEADKTLQGPSSMINDPEKAVSVSCLVRFCLVLGLCEISQGKPPW
jgi:hypothetical protein